MNTRPLCHACGISPGKLHQENCAVEQCPRCGTQALSCFCIFAMFGMEIETLEVEHPDVHANGPTDQMIARWKSKWGRRRIPWSGESPGFAECREFEWYCRNAPGVGWVPCEAYHPAAVPDLSRLHQQATWSQSAQRFVVDLQSIPYHNRRRPPLPRPFPLFVIRPVNEPAGVAR
jgi:hypothetical protein